MLSVLSDFIKSTAGKVVMLALAVLVIGLILYLAGGFEALLIGLGVMIVLALLIAGLVYLFWTRKGRTRSVRIERELAKELRGKFSNAVEAIRNSPGGRQFFYRVPWFLLIGEPAAGKTVSLENSELSFPLGGRIAGEKGGTRNCNFWFANEGVIVDTAGRFAITESERDKAEWQAFLRLLKRARPRQPINGVIVAIPTTAIYGVGDAEALEDRVKKNAQELRGRIYELQTVLGVRFPIWFVVTKCDLVPGFREFCLELPPGFRKEAFGWTNPAGPGEPLDLSKLEEGFQKIDSRLREWRSHILCRSTFGSRVADLIYVFPEAFSELHTPLLRYAEIVCQPSIYEEPNFFRGIFFSSGLQELRVILDGHYEPGAAPQASGEPQSADYSHIVDLSAQQFQSKPYFIRDFYKQIVLRQKGLVAPILRIWRRRRRLSWAACVASLVLGVLALVGIMNLWSYTKDLKNLQNNLGAMAVMAQEVEQSTFGRWHPESLSTAQNGTYKNSVETFTSVEQTNAFVDRVRVEAEPLNVAFLVKLFGGISKRDITVALRRAERLLVRVPAYSQAIWAFERERRATVEEWNTDPDKRSDKRLADLSSDLRTLNEKGKRLVELRSTILGEARRVDDAPVSLGKLLEGLTVNADFTTIEQNLKLTVAPPDQTATLRPRVIQDLVRTELTEKVYRLRTALERLSDLKHNASAGGVESILDFLDLLAVLHNPTTLRKTLGAFSWGESFDWNTLKGSLRDEIRQLQKYTYAARVPDPESPGIFTVELDAAATDAERDIGNCVNDLKSFLREEETPSGQTKTKTIRPAFGPALELHRKLTMEVLKGLHEQLLQGGPPPPENLTCLAMWRRLKDAVEPLSRDRSLSVSAYHTRISLLRKSFEEIRTLTAPEDQPSPPAEQPQRNPDVDAFATALQRGIFEYLGSTILPVAILPVATIEPLDVTEENVTFKVICGQPAEGTNSAAIPVQQFYRHIADILEDLAAIQETPAAAGAGGDATPATTSLPEHLKEAVAETVGRERKKIVRLLTVFFPLVRTVLETSKPFIGELEKKVPQWDPLSGSRGKTVLESICMAVPTQRGRFSSYWDHHIEDERANVVAEIIVEKESTWIQKLFPQTVEALEKLASLCEQDAEESVRDTLPSKDFKQFLPWVTDGEKTTPDLERFYADQLQEMIGFRTQLAHRGWKYVVGKETIETIFRLKPQDQNRVWPTTCGQILSPDPELEDYAFRLQDRDPASLVRLDDFFRRVKNRVRDVLWNRWAKDYDGELSFLVDDTLKGSFPNWDYRDLRVAFDRIKRLDRALKLENGIRQDEIRSVCLALARPTVTGKEVSWNELQNEDDPDFDQQREQKWRQLAEHLYRCIGLLDTIATFCGSRTYRWYLDVQQFEAMKGTKEEPGLSPRDVQIPWTLGDDFEAQFEQRIHSDADGGRTPRIVSVKEESRRDPLGFLFGWEKVPHPRGPDLPDCYRKRLRVEGVTGLYITLWVYFRHEPTERENSDTGADPSATEASSLHIPVEEFRELVKVAEYFRDAARALRDTRPR